MNLMNTLRIGTSCLVFHGVLQRGVVPILMKKVVGEGKFERHTLKHQNELCFHGISVLNGILGVMFLLYLVLVDQSTFTDILSNPLSFQPPILSSIAPIILGYLSLKLVREFWRQAELSDKPYDPQGPADEPQAQILPIIFIVLDMAIISFTLFMQELGSLGLLVCFTSICDACNGLFMIIKLTLSKAEMSPSMELFRKSLMVCDCVFPVALRFFPGPFALLIVRKYFTSSIETDMDPALGMVALVVVLYQTSSWILRTIFTAFIMFGMNLDPDANKRE